MPFQARLAVTILVPLVSSLPSCDAPTPGNIDAAPQVTESRKTSITIRKMAGEPKEEAFLVEPARVVSLDQLAGAVRKAGNPCEEVTAFNQLEQNGEPMDVYKLDCEKRAYQVTVLADSARIKRWTGNIFGQ